MRRDRTWWRIVGIGGLTASLAAAAGGTAGCDGDGPGGAGGTGGGGGGGGSAPDDPVKAACVGDFRVGKAPGGECPVPHPESGWVAPELLGGGYNLFGTGDPTLAAYCLYQWKDDTTEPAPEKLPPLDDGTPGAKWTDADCAAVASLGKSQEVVDLLAPSLWASFLTQVDAPSGLPLPQGSGRARVAVIDSWPAGGAIGELPHGFGMAGVVDGLTCALFGASPCPIATRPQLALNLLEPRARAAPGQGGYFGHFHRLARTIQRAVLDFQADGPLPDDRLILNLSIGWDPVFDQEKAPDVPIEPVQAVRDVLRWAACQDALVVAAAGNTSGGPNPGDGPTNPAAWWTSDVTPVCDSCPNGGCPVLTSVAGVDGADLPLSNARRNARPPLVAPAFAVPATKAVPDLGGAPSTVGPFTGSSVSAAVVSAAAAMVWAHDPGLPRAEVTKRLYTTGVDLGVPAESCAAASCPSVRRVSLCQALAASGANLTCDPPPAGAGLNPTVTEAEHQAITDLSPSEYDGTTLTDTVTACGGPVSVPAGDTTLTAKSGCPLAELPTSLLNVAIDPQPGPNPCPACTAMISTPDDWIILDMLIYDQLREPNNYVYAQVLTLLDADQRVLERYDLAAATRSEPLEAGEAYRVILDWSGRVSASDVRSAVVEWFDPTYRTSSESQLVLTIRE